MSKKKKYYNYCKDCTICIFNTWAIVFFLSAFTLLSSGCRPTYNFKAYEKKTLSPDCSAAWDLLTKYLSYKRRDLILVMEHLPLTPKEDFISQIPDYFANFADPLNEYVKTHKDCFTQFTRKEIEDILGKPTSRRETYVKYYIRTGEPIEPQCPAWKVRKIDRTNDITTRHSKNVFSGCRFISIHYDKHNYVSSIEFY